jgi:hypothetical protein
MGFLMVMILAVFAGFVVIMVGLWVAFNTHAWTRFKGLFGPREGKIAI